MHPDLGQPPGKHSFMRTIVPSWRDQPDADTRTLGTSFEQPLIRHLGVDETSAQQQIAGRGRKSFPWTQAPPSNLNSFCNRGTLPRSEPGLRQVTVDWAPTYDFFVAGLSRLTPLFSDLRLYSEPTCSWSLRTKLLNGR